MAAKTKTTVADIQAVFTKLKSPFPDSDILQDRQRPDGFRPMYIPWDKIMARIDAATDGHWNWSVRSFQFQGNQAIVHGTLEIAIGDTVFSRDGIGAVQLECVNNCYTTLGDDMKAAEADALKRAAVKFGVGLQLYQRDYQQKNLADQAKQAQELPIQPFQIEKVLRFLSSIGQSEIAFCLAAKIDGLNALTNHDVSLILAGQHPAIQRGNGRPQTPRTGLTGSNA